MKHQRKSQRPEGMSKKTIRKMAAKARKRHKLLVELTQISQQTEGGYR